MWQGGSTYDGWAAGDPAGRRRGRPDRDTNLHIVSISSGAQMAFESNIATMIGNLTDDPELRFTPSGAAVANFTVASNRRYTDRSGNQQEETTFMRVNCWRDMAENVAESLHKGDRTIVIGRIRVRSYEDQSGQTKWITEIEADEVAPSLRWARASVNKSTGSSGAAVVAGPASATPAPPAPATKTSRSRPLVAAS